LHEIILGTRGSELALCQAEIVRDLLGRAHPGLPVTIRVVRTSADRDLHTSLRQFPDQGVFVRELERALLDGEITAAVHSLKDLPSALPAGLCLAACPQREDPRDALVSREGLPLAALPAGATVGTGSPRRQAQLGHLRPDLRFVDVRGNLGTRLGKLQTPGRDADARDADVLDALILAAAGLHRIGRAAVITEYLALEQCVPAAGQGALALEAREDAPLLPLLRGLTDPAVEAAVVAERQTIADLNAGCTTPLGVHGEVQGDRLVLRAALASTDGARLVREIVTGSLQAPAEAGHALAAALRAQGAEELIRAAQAGAAGE
jgi:hydroxymethylbilane synthase